jgi:hypothetical protein
VDVAYGGLKGIWRSLFLLAEGEVTGCAVCNKHVDQNTGMVVVCPVDSCRAASYDLSVVSIPCQRCVGGRFDTNRRKVSDV